MNFTATHEIIESQHIMIDSAIEKLKDIVVERNKSEWDEERLLDSLIAHFDMHFKTEEIILRQIDISEDNLLEHLKEHEDLMGFLLSAKEKETISVELILKLKSWSDNHIETMDKPAFEILYPN